jgi:hypothetical protein
MANLPTPNTKVRLDASKKSQFSLRDTQQILLTPVGSGRIESTHTPINISYTFEKSSLPSILGTNKLTLSLNLAHRKVNAFLSAVFLPPVIYAIFQ